MGTELESAASASARRRVVALVRAWLPTTAFIVLIMTLSFQPAPRLPQVRHFDKYLHAATYGMLAFLAYRSSRRSGLRWPRFLAVLLAVCVGLADEGIQSRGSLRVADRYDLLADSVGAILAMCIVRPGKREGRHQEDRR